MRSQVLVNLAAFRARLLVVLVLVAVVVVCRCRFTAWLRFKQNGKEIAQIDDSRTGPSIIPFLAATVTLLASILASQCIWALTLALCSERRQLGLDWIPFRRTVQANKKFNLCEKYTDNCLIDGYCA